MLSELGTRQNCRDNVAMFAGHSNVGYYIMSIFIVATPFRPRNLNMFRIFVRINEALFLCSAVVVVVVKLTDCRVPTSLPIKLPLLQFALVSTVANVLQVVQPTSQWTPARLALPALMWTYWILMEQVGKQTKHLISKMLYSILTLW